MKRDMTNTLARMRRMFLSGLMVAAAGLQVPALAQQATPGSSAPNPAPVTNPGQVSATQQPAASNQLGSAAANQANPALAPQTQAGNTLPNNFQNFGPFQPNPFFADPSVRQNLGINDDMFGRMNNGFAQSFDRFNQGLAGLQNQNDLSQNQRMARIRELQGNFFGDVQGLPNDVLQDPAMQQRFNQLFIQQLGPQAFSLPAVQQQLGLTPQQTRQLNALQQRWLQQMQRLSVNFANDPDGPETFNQLRNRAVARIRRILDEEQFAQWQQLMGQPFDFPIRSFFPEPQPAAPTLNPGASSIQEGPMPATAPTLNGANGGTSIQEGPMPGNAPTLNRGTGGQAAPGR